MTQEEIKSLLYILEVFNFDINEDEKIEEKFTFVEKQLGFNLAESYKICMKKYTNIVSSFRHIAPIEEILLLNEIEEQEIKIPKGFYVLEYLDDFTILQNSKGEIYISAQNAPIKYADNLEIYLKERWNDNIIEKIKDNLEFNCDKAYNLQEIKEAEKILELCFAANFREYLRSFSYVGKGNRKLLNLLEVVEETLKARKDNLLFPKDCYVIERIEEKLIIQNNLGIIYERQDYKNTIDRGISLAQYLIEDIA